MNNNNIPTAPEYIKNFEQLGFGMFVHFGLYSALERGEWTYSIHGRDREEYMALAKSFDVGGMKDIVSLAKTAGCKYINITTRHHDGFSLYDTKGLSDFDVMHSKTGRDLIKEYVDEARSAGLVPFFYHTTLDWTCPLFEENFEEYLKYLHKSVELLCTNYGEIGGLWFDGNWSKPEADWREGDLYKMIRSHQKNAIIIDNTGLSARGKMGHEEIDAVTYERGLPCRPDLTGRSKYVTGEMCETICDHWGYADDLNFKSVKTLIEELCECRKVGANFLLNVGPYADGSVSNMQKGIMESIGSWMGYYGKAIYNGRPYLTYTDRREFILKDAFDENVAYLFKFGVGQSSGDENVSLDTCNHEGRGLFTGIDRKVKSIRYMDNGENVGFTQSERGLDVEFAGFAYGQNLCVRVCEIEFE